MKEMRHLTKAALRFLSRVLIAAIKLGLLFVSGVIALLASAARTSSAADSISGSVRGGELNLRTGRFDDGTDPDGFYDFE